MTIDTVYCIEYKNDGSWWTYRCVNTFEKANKLLTKAKKQGNGNKARIILTTAIRIATLLKETK